MRVLLLHDHSNWYREHGTGYAKITEAARDAERAMRKWEENPKMFG
jgi:hypothetical protein